MTEFNENLWAPWRMDYIRSLDEEMEGGVCFLCRYWSDPASDQAHHVVWRGRSCLAVLNRFPYTNGHLMVCPQVHVSHIEDIPEKVFVEMSQMTRDAVALLKETVHAHGFNIGYNLGACAGAGLPDHVHAHIVPRWSGDTNYMAVLGKTRVVPDALDAIHAELVAAARSAGLVE